MRGYLDFLVLFFLGEGVLGSLFLQFLGIIGGNEAGLLLIKREMINDLRHTCSENGGVTPGVTRLRIFQCSQDLMNTRTARPPAFRAPLPYLNLTHLYLCKLAHLKDLSLSNLMDTQNSVIPVLSDVLNSRGRYQTVETGWKCLDQ